MNVSKHTKRRAAGFGAAIAAVLIGAPAAEATTVFGVTKKGELAKFDSAKPSKVNTKNLKGLPNGVKLVGIDQRPSNGDLYGVGDDSTVYEISNNGKASAVGDGFDNIQINPPSPGVALDGKSFGVDFNPVPDAIRIVSDTGQNLRVSPSTGDLVAEDGDLNGADATIVDAAYTNSQQTDSAPLEAVLYVLDASKDTVYTQSPPNDGTLTNPVKLKGVDITKKSGFDLIGSGKKGLIVDGKGKASTLYQVKQEKNQVGLKGKVKKLGKVKAGSPLTAVAVDQPQAAR